jgi:hypothetical protein
MEIIHCTFCKIIIQYSNNISPSNLLWFIIIAFIGTVDGQIKLGQKSQSHKSKFTNLHRLITALSQIG